MVGQYKFTLNKKGFSAYQFTRSFSRNLKNAISGIHNIAKEELKDGVYDYISSSIPSGRTYDIVSRYVGRANKAMSASYKSRYPFRQETFVRNIPSVSQSKGKTRSVKQYDRSDVFYNHTASAPGQPPAILSGDLIKSIYTRKNTFDSFSIGSTSSYGSIFEGHPSQHNLLGEGVSVGGELGGLSASRYVSATMMSKFGGGRGNTKLISKYRSKLMSLYGTRPFISPVIKAKRTFLRDLYTKAIFKFANGY